MFQLDVCHISVNDMATILLYVFRGWPKTFILECTLTRTNFHVASRSQWYGGGCRWIYVVSRLRRRKATTVARQPPSTVDSRTNCPPFAAGGKLASNEADKPLIVMCDCDRRRKKTFLMLEFLHVINLLSIERVDSALSEYRWLQ